MDKHASGTKITIVGDMMCEPRLLKAARHGKEYDFAGVFENVRELFKESDYVIGNLETPLAGRDAVYTNRYLSFNTPDSFAEAAHEAGFDLLLTANNHCLDRGLDGLKRTLRVLDAQGIPHTGTFLNETDPRFQTIEIGGTKVAVISYTYGTNYSDNHLVLEAEEAFHINLLRPQQERYYVSKTPSGTGRKKRILSLGNLLNIEQRMRLKKLLHQTYNTPHEDNHLIEDTAEPYIKRMCADIADAKKASDVVLFLPHIGGQFNIRPGSFSEFAFRKALDAGCDAIIGSHPHIVQKAAFKGAVPCFYSIGNFSMSPNDFYLLHEHHPEYGLAVHLYLEERRIVHVTFSILKIVEHRGDILTVYPVDEMFGRLTDEKKKARLQTDIQGIVQTVTGRKPSLNETIRREYTLETVEDEKCV